MPTWISLRSIRAACRQCSPSASDFRACSQLATWKQAENMDDTLVVTPGGPRLRSTVHLVQPNTTPIVATRVATSLTKSKIAGRPEAANWITAAWLDMTGATVTSFSTNWTVPPGPSQESSQLLYLFSGMQPTLASTILQPVLQWGGTDSDEDG